MNAHDSSLHREVPQNIEAEQALLGAILVNNAAFDVAQRILAAEHFNEALHRTIYEIASKFIAAGRKVDPITIKGHLPTDVKGLTLDGQPATVMAYLARLAASAVSVVNARDYALAIHDAWVGRQALSAAHEAVDAILDLDPGKSALDQLILIEDRIAGLRAQSLRGESRKGIGARYLENMNAVSMRGEVYGVPICLPEIARVISEPCFEAGNLYGLLSSSGEGKTALTVQIAHHALRMGHPVLILSYDQSSDQFVRQMIAQRHGIEARRQRDPKLLSEKEWDTCVGFGHWVDTQPMEIIKCTSQGAPQLVGFARTFVKRYAGGKKPLIVVDHIGSVTPEDKRADEGTKAKGINQLFKAGAEVTDAPWLILNQRNSYGMKRDNPRPISADLFGGDPAKQAYDAIFYLYRFLKFLEDRKAVASTGSDFKKIETVFPSAVRVDGQDIAEIGVVKCRFGNPHVKERLLFEAPLTRYASLTRNDQPELIGGFDG